MARKRAAAACAVGSSPVPKAALGKKLWGGEKAGDLLALHEDGRLDKLASVRQLSAMLRA